ncbi:MAG: hypothetical protein ABUK16_11950, partial [Anaerolineales bacterium]
LFPHARQIPHRGKIENPQRHPLSFPKIQSPRTFIYLSQADIQGMGFFFHRLDPKQWSNYTGRPSLPPNQKRSIEILDRQILVIYYITKLIN